MVGHGGSSAGSYLADPTSPIPSHCASIVTTSTVRVKMFIVTCTQRKIKLLNNSLRYVRRPKLYQMYLECVPNSIYFLQLIIFTTGVTIHHGKNKN